MGRIQGLNGAPRGTGAHYSSQSLENLPRPTPAVARPPAPAIMEQLTPQVMQKLVFTILVHGLPDTQTNVAFEVLVEAQNNPNAQVRELAVVATAELPVPPAKRVGALAKALRDPSARVRRRAARALGDFGLHAVPAVPVLVTGLKDTDTSVRRDCAGTLGRLGPAAAPAAGDLVSILTEPDTRSRVVAATALKRVGLAAVPALLDGLRRPNADLRHRCAAVLMHLAPDDAEVAAAIRAAEEDTARRESPTSEHDVPLALAVM